MLVVVLICAYLVLTSLIAYAAFAWDKRCAVRGTRRIPEARLLFWAAIGGWPGAKLAQHKLRHKTYKQPFGRNLNGVALVQVMVVLTGLLLVSMTASNQRVANAPLPSLSQTSAPAQIATPTERAEPAGLAAPQAAPVTTATDDVQDTPPADGPLSISLRPPAARPSGS